MATRRNRRTLVPNPAWVTDALAAAWENLDDVVAPAWLPILDSVKSTADDRISGRIHEFGCGKYGCVFPTHDPNVVMKVTSDDTEAEFAAHMAATLARPICVTYHAVSALDYFRDKRRVYLLWRETAYHVGAMGEVLGVPAVDYVMAQHAAAQIAYWALQGAVTRRAMVTWRADWEAAADRLYQHELQKIYLALVNLVTNGPFRVHEQARAALAIWVRACETMARQTEVPEIRALGDGMVEVYTTQRILFGDIHDGNLGIVHRDDGGHWVITDPGHIAVVSHL